MVNIYNFITCIAIINYVSSLATNIQTINMKEPQAKKKFTSSLQTTGFAVVINHGISLNQLNSVYTEWNTFLKKIQLSPHLEKKYIHNLTQMDGYFPPRLAEIAKNSNKRDIKHYYQIYTNGRYPQEISKETLLLFNDMITLGKKLLQWIDTDLNEISKKKLYEHNGFNSLEQTISIERTMMRILHYPAYDFLNIEPGQMRAAPHEDINWITLLPAGTTRGLQLNLSGQGWVDVPYDPNSIIINIGDMLQELTNGQFKSTTHRVINNLDGTERMSIPCFIHPKADIYLSTKYTTANDYLMERLNELQDDKLSSCSL